MPRNKNQHFVPQFFLKNFSDDKKSISMCLRQSGKVIDRVSIKDQCSKPYLYPDQEFEKKLGMFEADCAKAIEKVVSGKHLEFNTNDALCLRSFLLLQRLRTLHEARLFKEGLEQIRQYILSHDATDSLKAQVEQYENTERSALELLASGFRGALEITGDLTCKLLHYEGKGSFLTSDDPVIQYNPLLERHGISQYGLAAIGLLLLLPISPNYAIVLYDSAFYKIGKRKDWIIHFTSPRDLYWINLLTILHTDKAFYCFPGSFTRTDLGDLVDQANRFNQSEDIHLSSFKGPDGQSDILHSYSHNYRINASFSFLKKLDKARGILFSNTIGVEDYSRPYCSKWLNLHPNYSGF